MTFIVGDIIEPQCPRLYTTTASSSTAITTTIPAGRYEIIRFGPRAVKLWRLLGSEQIASTTTQGRTVVIPIAQLEMFQLVAAPE